MFSSSDIYIQLITPLECQVCESLMLISNKIIQFCLYRIHCHVSTEIFNIHGTQVYTLTFHAQVHTLTCAHTFPRKQV